MNNTQLAFLLTTLAGFSTLLGTILIFFKFKNKNKTKMILWCLKDNEPSKKFYKKMGGEITKERTFEIEKKNYYEVGFIYNI